MELYSLLLVSFRRPTSELTATYTAKSPTPGRKSRGATPATEASMMSTMLDKLSSMMDKKMEVINGRVNNDLAELKGALAASAPKKAQKKGAI